MRELRTPPEEYSGGSWCLEIMQEIGLQQLKDFSPSLSFFEFSLLQMIKICTLEQTQEGSFQAWVAQKWSYHVPSDFPTFSTKQEGKHEWGVKKPDPSAFQGGRKFFVTP